MLQSRKFSPLRGGEIFVWWGWCRSYGAFDRINRFVSIHISLLWSYNFLFQTRESSLWARDSRGKKRLRNISKLSM